MISIVDYGAGNVGAIQRLLNLSRVRHTLVSQPDGLTDAERILLPGVGAFDQTMRALNRKGLTKAIKQANNQGVPILGICIGMHTLANSSEEGSEPGLGLIDGTVKRFDPSLIQHAAKVPHMGWNSVQAVPDHPLFMQVEQDHGFYFLHSYYFSPSGSTVELSTTEHGICFASAVVNGSVAGVQFHPEKSHSNGMRLMENFSKWSPC